MKLFALRLFTGVLAVIFLFGGCKVQRIGKAPQEKEVASVSDFVLVIHGGAGTIRRENMTPELEAAYRNSLMQALNAGYVILQEGGSSVDAVEAAIRVLEDDSLFNAGKGAVLDSKGAASLDASIMSGSDLNAGAVAAVRRVKHPISLARAVMEKSPHVMLVGDGAEEFAQEQGLELVPPDYFITFRKLQQWKAIKAQEGSSQASMEEVPPRNAFGTVGAVALDKAGNLAAGTSTGGMMNKKYGRVGDSPIIGAGTYANNLTCAVSATGHGEYFIRSVATHTIHALMAYKKMSLQEATEAVLKQIEEMGGSGGVIAVDRQGHIAMPFTTEGMYRGYITADGQAVVKIYR